MCSQIPSLSEPFPAQLTILVLLSRMNLHVSINVSFLSKTFPTNLNGRFNEKI